MKPVSRKAAGRWLLAIALALGFFYGLDHLVMRVQGLPLAWNMAPRN